MATMSAERIADLNADGTETGRVLAVKPDGNIVGIPAAADLKPGFRFATRADIDALRGRGVSGKPAAEVRGPSSESKPAEVKAPSK